MDFEYNEKQVQEADKAADAITESGTYVGTFTAVNGIDAASGAKGLQFNFNAPGIGDTSFNLYTHGKDGNEIFGMNQVQAIMFLCGVKSLKATKGKVEKWEEVEGKRAKVEVEGNTYPALCAKPIGLVLQKELYTTNKGGSGSRINLYGTFQAETQLMSSEIKNKVTKPVKLARLIAGLKTKDSRKAATPESAQPSMGALPDGDW